MDRILCLLAIAALAATSALAQTPREEGAQPRTTIVFGEGDLIEAGLDKPDIEMINAPLKPKHPPLIRHREDFNRKVVGSLPER